MILNPKILRIRGKDMISFNDGLHLIIVDEEIIYRTKYSAKILGILQDSLIILIKNKYIVSLDFPSFALNVVLYEGSIDAHTFANSNIWFVQQNMIYCIGTEMQISLYDDFTHLQLLKIDYLYDLATLAFIVKDGAKLKILFEDPLLPTLCFSDISSIPEISFESQHEIVLTIGRSVLKYDIQQKKLQALKKINPVKLRWNSIRISVHYKIISTEMIVNKKESRTHYIDGDVWKIINTGRAIYLFSDSINTPISVVKIGFNGSLSRVYNLKKHNYLIDFKESNTNNHSPFLKLLPHDNINKTNAYSAVFFIHGGPHQKAGNLWDPLLNAFLQQNYPIYVPQYPGTFGMEGIDGNYAVNYGIDDFEDLIRHYDQIRKIHQKVILVGHSYGAFLGLKLFLKKNADILIGINGVYDLKTISFLNPKTYANLSEREKVTRSPKCLRPALENCGEWHHIHFKNDPLIKPSDLKSSLNQIGSNEPIIHYLNFGGHGTFNSTQSSQIVKLIKAIEQQFYKRSNR